MLPINYYGKSFVIDRSTNIILFIHVSNEIAKFVSSCIMDTAVEQYDTYFTKNIRQEVLDNSAWAKVSYRPMAFTDVIDPPEKAIQGRARARMMAHGFYILQGQVTIVSNSYDNLGDLNLEDLPLYMLYKDRFAAEYAATKTIPLESAKKHLEFLADSLTSVYFRKQTLVWEYAASLKTVQTNEQFDSWRESLLKETVGLGQV
jgi:hypothetical protein